MKKTKTDVFVGLAARVLVLSALVAPVGCGGCDDDVNPGGGSDAAVVDADGTDVGRDAEPLDASGPDVTHDGGGLDDTGEDVRPPDAAQDTDTSTGPRAPLEFVRHGLVEQPRTNAFDIVPSDASFYLATSSAGNPVVFGVGEPEELAVGGTGSDGFGAIWARYSNDLTFDSAEQISTYAGGPRAGGTSNGRQLVLDDDGARLIAGSFAGSVRFGSTNWSTSFSDANGALTTAYEGFVVRATDTGVQALFRLRSTDAYDSVRVTSIVLHQDGQITVSGSFRNEMILPDGSSLSSGEFRGFVIRTTLGGEVQYAWATPGSTYAHDYDGEDVLVRMNYRAAFELAGQSYPAPAEDRGYAFARLDQEGQVVWMRRLEGNASARVGEPEMLPQGDIVVAVRASDVTFNGFANPPVVPDGEHVMRLTPQGEVDWVDSLPDEANPWHGAMALDGAGIVWTATSVCSEQPLTLQPAFEPALVLPACDPLTAGGDSLLVGRDSQTGEIAYVHHLFNGSGTLDDVEVLSDGTTAVSAHYFDAITVEPSSAQPLVMDEPNRVNGLLLLLR